MIAFLKHLIPLMLHKYSKMTKFGLVGISGTLINFGLLYAFTSIASLWYIFSAILATIVASTSNYFLNHLWVFKGRGIANHSIGWTKYQILSTITDGIYIGFLALFVEVVGLWYILGAFLSLLIVFPIKYKVATIFVWKEKRNPDAAGTKIGRAHV